MTFTLNAEVAAVLAAATERSGPPPAPPVGDVASRRVALDAMLEYFNNQAQPVAPGVEGVAELGGDHHLVPVTRQRPAEHSLAVPSTVDVRGVEERDSQLERAAQGGGGLIVVGITPASGLPSIVTGPPMAQHPNPIVLTSMPLRPRTLFIPVPFDIGR
jgi:hypothetical protein